MRNTTGKTRWSRVTATVLAFGLVLAACGGDDDAADPATDDTDDAADDAADDVDDADDEVDDEATDDDAADDDAAADDPPELDPVGPIQMGTIATPPIFAMVLPHVADEAGFYDKYNVEVDTRPMETGVDAARAVQGGDLDVAWSPTGPVMTFAGTGVDVTAIFGQDNIDWLVGSVNPDVTSCEDLEGETIAVDSVGGARYSVLEIILDSCGLTTDDVDAAAFPGPAAIQAVVAGQLDTSVIHIDDLYVIEEQGEDDMHVVSMLADVDPTQHYLVFWALEDTVQAEREALVRMLAAYIDAVRFMNDPAHADEVAAIGTVTGHSDAVVAASMEDFLELEFWPLDRDGLPEDKIESTISEQVRLENIEEGSEPSFDDVVDASLWADAMELVEQMN